MGLSKTPAANHRRPLPFGNAYVAKRWARAWPSYWTMCSASRCGNPSGNTWGWKRKWRRGRNKEEEEEASWEPLGALLGPPGSFLGASWRPLGGLLGPLGRLRRLFGGLFGRLRAFLARLTPSEAVLGASLNRLGAFLGRLASLGLLGAFGGFLGASLAVLGRSWLV